MVDGGSIQAIDDARDQASASAAAALNSEQTAGLHASDTVADRSAVAADRAAAALSAGAAASSAGAAAGSADQAAGDKAIISGWRTQIEGWKGDIASDRNDVQDDKVTTALLADAAAISAAEAHEALDMLYQYGDFNSRYIGEHAANPTSWNSGNSLDPGTDPLISGLIYYNTYIEEYRTYSGTDWASGAGNTSDFARKSLNGGDYNAATFRANLDLYSTSQTLNLPAGRTAASAIDDADFVQVVVAGAWRKMAWTIIKSWIKGFLGNSATRDVGTSPNTVAAGDDGRIVGAFQSANVVDEDDMASNSDTKVPTQQSVKAHVDALPMLGVGQTWQVVTTSRSKDTVYQNTTHAPILIAIARGAGGDSNIDVSPNGVAWVTAAKINDYSTASVIVPVGWYYRSSFFHIGRSYADGMRFLSPQTWVLADHK